MVFGYLIWISLTIFASSDLAKTKETYAIANELKIDNMLIKRGVNAVKKRRKSVFGWVFQTGGLSNELRDILYDLVLQ